ncbi:MAG TPA: hypothetical protein VF606_03270 [Geminicoccaceae bacterium]
MSEITLRVVSLADYRRDTWSTADAAWEQTATGAVAAFAREERLRAATLLQRAEVIARLHLPPDDPRRAASLTLLARWQLGLGNRAQADRLRAEAERAWSAAGAWVARLRPAGADPAALADTHRLLGSAATLTGSLAAGHGEEPAGAARLVPTPGTFARLTPDRRKLVAAVALATARLEPAREADDPAASRATRS